MLSALSLSSSLEGDRETISNTNVGVSSLPLSHGGRPTVNSSLVEISSIDYSSTNPLINKLHVLRRTLQNVPGLWTEMAKINPHQIAVIDERNCDDNKIQLTFAEMEETVRTSAAVFQGLGVKKGMNVAIFADNSARWLMADHGIQMAGGVSAVRGADAPLDELRYVYEHSDAAGIAVLQGPRLLKKLHAHATRMGLSKLGLENPSYGPVQNIILLNDEKTTQDELKHLGEEIGIQIHVFTDLLKETNLVGPEQLPILHKDDLSTIVYTSGTTGKPKGVMLSHGNLLHQTSHRLSFGQKYEETEPLPNETMVCILPIWHITQRTFELWMLLRSCKLVYSNVRHFRNDMARHKPEWFLMVPRVLESIAAGIEAKFNSQGPFVKTLASLFIKTGAFQASHAKIAQGLVVGDVPPSQLQRLVSRTMACIAAPINAIGEKLLWSKVKEGFGGNIKAIVLGGSALSGILERFYEAAGFRVLVGYGLTECSPLLTYRRVDANLIEAGSCGTPCSETEVRVVDPQSQAVDESGRESLPTGEVGVVIGRGPQVMKGYYRNPIATSQVLDKYGWFETGDLGRINPATGDLILTGRVKDTIVLSNGENIEPQPIEDAILGASDLIEQVMLTGQDGRHLVAIAVLRPSELVLAGFMSQVEGDALQAATEIINDPKCTKEDFEKNVGILRQTSQTLRGDKALQSKLEEDMKTATANFRQWEQVGHVFVTLEPFSMVNGQLTQSYKIRRAAVMTRYGHEM